MAGSWKFRYVISFSRHSDNGVKSTEPLEEVIASEVVLPVGEPWRRAREIAGPNRRVEKITKEVVISVDEKDEAPDSSGAS